MNNAFSSMYLKYEGKDFDDILPSHMSVFDATRERKKEEIFRILECHFEKYHDIMHI